MISVTCGRPAIDQDPSENQANTERLPEALRPFLRLCLNLNHDLANSLTGILGNADFLIEHPFGMCQTQVECVTEILQCAKLISQKVDALTTLRAVTFTEADRRLLAGNQSSTIEPTKADG